MLSPELVGYTRHIVLAFEDIQKNEHKYGDNTLYIGPSISHFIKLVPQKYMKAQLSQNNAAYKQHIAFVVNDCNGDLGSGEGSHWSLLVYARDVTTGITWTRARAPIHLILSK